MPLAVGAVIVGEAKPSSVMSRNVSASEARDMCLSTIQTTVHIIYNTYTSIHAVQYRH